MQKSLVLELDARAADAFADACLEAGALAVSAEDPLAGTDAEVPTFGEPVTKVGAAQEKQWPLPGDPAFPPPVAPPSPVHDLGHTAWPRARLSILLDETADVAALIKEASRAASLAETPAFRVEDVPDDDWVRKTQAQFEPIRISERLWIVPSWHEAPDNTAINIVLDPGVAFGTGSHPTTRLCLQWLEATVRGGESVLDYGCGSGILAIAAALLGAARVVGVDIDPVAVAAARDNAERNGVQAVFHESSRALREGNGALELQTDILVANILSNPLKLLAPALAGHVRPGGLLALSGVLAPQAEEVMDIYRSWFDFEPVRELEGWVCLSGRRKG